MEIAYVPFLEEVGWGVFERCFYIGRVFDQEGRLLPDWVSLWGKHRVIPRGRTKARCRQCEKCGRYVYFAKEDEYLYPAPRPEVEIFDSTGGLVYRPDIFERVRRTDWIRRFYVLELVVVEDPPDGLGVIPAE